MAIRTTNPPELGEDLPADPASASASAHPGENDLKALRRQIAASLPDLRGFARFLARDATLADDLVQDTIVRALGALDQFRAGTNLKAWLLTIQRNAFYEQARRRKHEQRLLARHGRDDESVAPHVERRQEVEELERLLWQLPPILREALVLVGAQEMALEAAAQVCGIPVGTMKARVSRARSQLIRLREDHAHSDTEEDKGA